MFLCRTLWIGATYLATSPSLEKSLQNRPFSELKMNFWGIGPFPLTYSHTARSSSLTSKGVRWGKASWTLASTGGRSWPSPMQDTRRQEAWRCHGESVDNASRDASQ